MCIHTFHRPHATSRSVLNLQAQTSFRNSAAPCVLAVWRFFFLFVGILSGTPALLGFGGRGVFFLSDMWVVRGLNSILLKCCVKQ